MRCRHCVRPGGYPFAEADPSLPVLWEPHLLPSVVVVGPALHGFGAVRAPPPSQLPDILARSEDGSGYSLMLDDPAGPHRLRIATGAHEAGGAFIIPDDDWLDIRLYALHRFLLKRMGLPTGIPPPEPVLPPYRHYRLALALRTLDGEAEGASRREIGIVLFPSEARFITARDWKNTALRKKIARLIRLGHAMRDGDYRHLLTRSFDRIRWS